MGPGLSQQTDPPDRAVPAGGGTDYVSRQVGAKLGESTGWTIVVENKAGAGGTIGLIEAARAAPDGYTIVMGQADNMIIAPALQKNLAINPVKDLTPVMQVASSPFLLMAAEADQKYRTLNDLIAAAKANPGKVAYGTAGNGTFTHLVMELLQVAGNFKMEQVPYKGANPAMTDLLGGHIPMAALSIGSGMPGIQGGKLRGLAVTSLKRSPALPDVPTLDEIGFKNFEANGWLGILVPNGTPPEIVARLNAELTKTMQNPDLRKTLIGQGIEVADQHAAGIRRAAVERHLEVAQDHPGPGHQGRLIDHAAVSGAQHAIAALRALPAHPTPLPIEGSCSSKASASSTCPASCRVRSARCSSPTWARRSSRSRTPPRATRSASRARCATASASTSHRSTATRSR